jgi:hypothetical protein
MVSGQRSAVSGPGHAASGAPRVARPLVEHRLSHDPTEERRTDDLTVAMEWLRDGHGVGLEDLLLPGDQPPRRISHSIARWLGWITDCPGAGDCQQCVS